MEPLMQSFVAHLVPISGPFDFDTLGTTVET